jgi:pimeloyl-ACP methyl ester carboxylesterase
MKIIAIALFFLATSSCLRMDRNVFNNLACEEYLWDNAPIDAYYKLDSTYDIAPENRYLFSLKSDNLGDTATIYAVYLGDTSRIDEDTVIVYTHGNASNMDYYYQRTKMLANLGHKHRYGVLMMDYRSYGKSTGNPTEENMYADVKACLQWLADRGLTNRRTIFYGFSLGTAPACKLAHCSCSPLTPQKVILEAPFAGTDVMANDGSGLNMPASFFGDTKLNNAEQVKSIKQPLMWIHGTADNYLSYKTHGEVVWRNYSGTGGKAVPVIGAGHETVPYIMGVKSYCDTLLNFIEK